MSGRLIGAMVALALGAAVFLASAPALAYVGPGAGFAFVTSFFLLLTTFLLALIALLTWPARAVIRLVLRKRPSLRRRFKRVIVVGLDGIDPKRVQRLMDSGELPNMKRLADRGSLAPLGTACPPLSPVAWSNFATGVDPSRHGIFDFLVRDRRTYAVKLSSADVRPTPRQLRLKQLQIPLGKPRSRLLQRSVPFWQILARYGVRSSILRVPITFPPKSFAGTLLSAMCVPDLLGSQGTFSYYSSDEAEVDRTSGRSIAVNPVDHAISTKIFGPRHPLWRDGREITLPLDVRLDPATKSAVLSVAGRKVTAKLGQFTEWVPVAFPLLPGIKLRGICRFLLRSCDPFRMYVTPINLDPENPNLAIAHPFSFSVYLSKLIGRYSTLGFAEDTWALNENAIDKDDFWQQVQLCQAERERMFFAMLQRIKKGACICVFDGTDRVQHMYMRDAARAAEAQATPSEASRRHAGRIDDIYRQMDQMLGRLYQKVDPDDPGTLLLVMSDHGFAAFERGLHLNNWLQEHGYLQLKPGCDRAGEFLTGIDWSKTRAYAVGLTGIFVNLKGREAKGIVTAKEAPALRHELAAKLGTITDPRDGSATIREAYVTAKRYSGPYLQDAPDIIIGYERGYRASWETVRGTAGEGVVADNPKHWSGDHCIAPELVPGVLLSNHPLNTEGASLLDLAPTILESFGVPKPPHMAGKALWTA